MSRAPYKYLDYYTYADADLYFGREKEIQRMVGEILSSRLLVLFSPSGSGKTSLINAGVRPALENIGYKTIYVRLKSEPVASVIDALAKELNLKFKSTDTSPDLYDFLKRAIDQGQQKEEPFKPLVLFLDQFEEFFIVFRDKPELRQEFIEQLAKIRYDVQMPVFVVLSLREDYFVNLHECRQSIPCLFQNNATI
ncbi:ATP-binding protein, partial [candidate division KSB1 bacterium]|nr:ATP-binding protein [candidate division KSB1 bacterium]